MTAPTTQELREALLEAAGDLDLPLTSRQATDLAEETVRRLQPEPVAGRAPLAATFREPA